jgi:hypothetical protein
MNAALQVNITSRRSSLTAAATTPVRHRRSYEIFDKVSQLSPAAQHVRDLAIQTKLPS